MQALVAECQEKIISGEIVVSTAMGMSAEEWAAKKATCALAE